MVSLNCFMRFIYISFILFIGLILVALNSYSQNLNSNKYIPIINKYNINNVVFKPKSTNLSDDTKLRLDTIGMIITELKSNNLDEYKIKISSCLCENEKNKNISLKRGIKIQKYLSTNFKIDNGKILINKENIICIQNIYCIYSLIYIHFYI